jgi:hypothetical protein
MRRFRWRTGVSSGVVRSGSVLGVLAWIGAACAPSPKDVGKRCSANAECITRLCYEDLCMNPLADDDGDGVPNGIEAAVGSSALARDTDADGIHDRDELGPAFEATDTDGDGKPDILESITEDADGDCIVDQVDARDDTLDDDKSPMIPVVCRVTGLCADRVSELVAVCPEGGAATCIYTGVAGYRQIETECDGVDENCNGTTDEGFEDRNANGIADCLEPRRFGRPFVGLVSGSGDFANSEMRMRVVVGPPIRGRVEGPDGALEVGLPAGQPGP